MVCEDTNKITIASTSKSFKTTSNCKSPIAWPNWKKDDYTVWQYGSTNNTGGLGNYLYDGSRMNLNWNQKYSNTLVFHVDSGGVAQRRGQTTTNNQYDLTNYKNLTGEIRCLSLVGTEFHFMIGITKSPTSWLHQGIHSPTVVSGSINTRYDAVLDISRYTGNYYISTNLYVNAGIFECHNDWVYLQGMTYGYGNTGL